MSDEEVASALRAYQEDWQQQNPFLTEDDRAILNQAALKSTKEASAWRKGYLDRISKQQKQSSVDVSDRF